MSDSRELVAELDVLSAKMLDACEAYVRARTPEAFLAWRVATQAYLERHQSWWAVVHPGVEYESVFGNPWLAKAFGSETRSSTGDCLECSGCYGAHTPECSYGPREP